MATTFLNTASSSSTATNISGTSKTPENMLHVICSALGMHLYHYAHKNRKRDFVELRFIAALLIRNYFPYVTLKQIGSYFGGQDHTSVINGLERGNQLLQVNDYQFEKKYKEAINAVTTWLGMERAA